MGVSKRAGGWWKSAADPVRTRLGDMQADGGTSAFTEKDVRPHRLIPAIGSLSERLVR
ncbi:hypothetical protein [Saccharibacillus sacchari]|uniref:Uncharacterized protein n=1 Tax=Saccharibacillus sacchari TaxID=456493 RepID=A0ACC6PCD8_9BACL